MNLITLLLILAIPTFLILVIENNWYTKLISSIILLTLGIYLFASPILIDIGYTENYNITETNITNSTTEKTGTIQVEDDKKQLPTPFNELISFTFLLLSLKMFFDVITNWNDIDDYEKESNKLEDY